MIRSYLANPGETAGFAALVVVGLFWPWMLAAAAAWFCGLEIAAGLLKRPGPRWWPAAWPRVDPPLTVLYDATCGLCARSKARIERWPTAASIRFVPLQSPEARVLVPQLNEQEYMGAMHVIEKGRVFSGAEAWYRLARRGPIGGALLAAVTPRAVARRVYAWVARNRYRWFGRVCDEGTCSVHPAKASGDRSSSPPSGSPGPS